MTCLPLTDYGKTRRSHWMDDIAIQQLCFYEVITLNCKRFVQGAGKLEIFLLNISGIDYCGLYVGTRGKGILRS